MSETTKVQAAYQGAAKVYHQGMGGDHQRSSARHLLASLTPTPQIGDRVLDLGCGTGIALFSLLELYPQVGECVGFDLSKQMLEVAEKEANELAHPLRWVQGDGQALPFGDASFELVISHNVFHWFKDRLQALSEIKRVLTENGRLAMLFEGAGARRFSLGIRSEVLRQNGLQPPPGLDPSDIAWNSLMAVEDLIEQSGLKAVDIWQRQSYTYIPVEALMLQFKSTTGYWSQNLTEEKVKSILAEIEQRLRAIATPKGFREILCPLIVVAQKQ